MTSRRGAIGDSWFASPEHTQEKHSLPPCRSRACITVERQFLVGRGCSRRTGYSVDLHRCRYGSGAPRRRQPEFEPRIVRWTPRQRFASLATSQDDALVYALLPVLFAGHIRALEFWLVDCLGCSIDWNSPYPAGEPRLYDACL